jgi:hypothetical protein
LEEWLDQFRLIERASAFANVFNVLKPKELRLEVSSSLSTFNCCVLPVCKDEIVEC